MPNINHGSHVVLLKQRRNLIGLAATVTKSEEICLLWWARLISLSLAGYLLFTVV
jgi:hypothetical protein